MVDCEAMLLPGIGGFPDFHADLIHSLTILGVRIQSAPCADARSTPNATFQQHLRYWTEKIEMHLAANESTLHLIGISFGAQVVVALPDELLAKTGKCVLISYWPFSSYQRQILRLLRFLLPRGAARLFGAFSFWWSERTSDDPAQLQLLRQELYDSMPLAHYRLLARLLTLRSAPVKGDFELFLCRKASLLVYGETELAFRLHRPWLHRVAARQPHLQIHVIQGGHDISTRRAPALSERVASYLQANE